MPQYRIRLDVALTRIATLIVLAPSRMFAFRAE